MNPHTLSEAEAPKSTARRLLEKVLPFLREGELSPLFPVDESAMATSSPALPGLTLHADLSAEDAERQLSGLLGDKATEVFNAMSLLKGHQGHVQLMPGYHDGSNADPVVDVVLYKTGQESDYTAIECHYAVDIRTGKVTLPTEEAAQRKAAEEAALEAAKPFILHEPIDVKTALAQLERKKMNRAFVEANFPKLLTHQGLVRMSLTKKQDNPSQNPETRDSDILHIHLLGVDGGESAEMTYDLVYRTAKGVEIKPNPKKMDDDPTLPTLRGLMRPEIPGDFQAVLPATDFLGNNNNMKEKQQMTIEETGG